MDGKMTRQVAFGSTALMLLCLSTGQAHAVLSSLDEPASSGEPAVTADPLRGPKVDGGNDAGASPGEGGGDSAMMTMKSGETTLVKRDFQGTLTRLELDPAQAALDLLDLSETERKDTQRILLERSAIMDGLVRDNLKEIVELAGARQAGDGERLRGGFRELLKKYEPLQARGRLIDELADAISEEKADQLRALVREYYRALYDDKKASAAAAGERLNFGKFVAEEFAAALGQEVKRSYERVVQSQTADFEKLLGELRLNPEQESKVRQAMGDLFQKTYGKPTAAQRTRVFFEVWQVLDTEQRKILMERTRAENGVLSAQTPPVGPRATPPSKP